MRSLFLSRVRSDVPLLRFKLRVMECFSSSPKLGDVMTGIHLLITTFRCLKGSLQQADTAGTKGDRTQAVDTTNIRV